MSWVPEPLGFDRQGNEILSFIEGEVPQDTPAWLWNETLLSEVARALRQFHDATADFACDNACWQLASREPHEVICHSDFAPYNTTFINGHFAGLIDFDTCAPGPRIWDIAYTAYRFVPLLPMPGEIDVPAGSEYSPISREMQQARLHRFLDAYADKHQHLRYTVEAVLAQTAIRLDTLAEFSEAEAKRSQRAALSGHAQMYRAHAAWLRQRICALSRND